MNELFELGFDQAGHWKLVDGKLNCKLDRFRESTNVLYAFVCNGEVMYVGKTINTLAKRMSRYAIPHASQGTNHRLNRLIIQSLLGDLTIQILALPDSGLMHLGKFHVNLAAGLEDSVIAKLKPAWNGFKSRRSPEVLGDATDESVPIATGNEFEFTLQRTYFEKGFFNVPIVASDWFAGDGQKIEIFCGNASQPITGIINRTANTNGTPRVFGGVRLRDWLQSNFSIMDTVIVQAYSPVSIRVGLPSF